MDEEEEGDIEDEEEEGDTAPPTSQPPPPPPPPPPSSAAAAAAKTRRAEDQLLKAAIDESLQKPVDPRKLASSKVHTATIPLLAQPLTASTAVAWPSTSSPPPGARLVLSASVQAQRPPPHLGSDIHIPARGMCCMLLQCMSVNS